MDLDEIRTHLFEAAKMRVPRFNDRDTTGMKAEKLEDYILKVAYVRGDLEEARLYVQQVLHDLDGLWRNMDEAWRGLLPSKLKGAATQPQIVEAKRQFDPALYEQIIEARFLATRLTEQINRLSHMGDDQVASRVYTIMAGS